MSSWVITFHGGDTASSSAINTLTTVQLSGTLPAMRELRGFAVGPDGNLYVVNAYKDNSLIFQFGPAASLPAGFIKTFVTTTNLSHPFDLAFGPDGNLYVSNQDNNYVTVFQGPNGASPGAYVSDFISSGLKAVRGIACDGTHWFVADEKGNKTGTVWVYDLSGNLKKYSLPVADPVHLVYDGARYLYIGSGSGNDVWVYDTTDPNHGAPISIFGHGGASPAINATAGLALPGDNCIYVASRKGQQILKYPLTTATTAGAGSVLFDQLPDQPEFIGMLGGTGSWG